MAIDDVAVPSSAAEAHGYLVVATRSWEQALDGFDDAIVAVVDGTDESAAQALADVLILLRVGDVAYAEFLARVGDFDSGIAQGNFASIAFVPTDGPVRFEPTAIENRLTSTYQLGSQHNISITAMTDPAPIGERNSVPIVPDPRAGMAPPIDWRSFINVVRDTRQPSPGAPSISLSWIFVSEKKTSLNSASPVI